MADGGVAETSTTESGAGDTGVTFMSQPCTVTTSNAVGTNYTAPPAMSEVALNGGTGSLARISLFANFDGGISLPTLEVALASLTAGTQTLVMRPALAEIPPSILFADLGSTSNCSGGGLCNQYAWGTEGGGTVTIADLTAKSFHMTVSGALMEPLGGGTDGGMNVGTGAMGSFTLAIDCPLIAR